MRRHRRGHHQEAVRGDPLHAPSRSARSAGAPTRPAPPSCTCTGAATTGSRRTTQPIFEAYKREIEARCPVIINFSTGAVGLTKEQRINHILKTRPHIGALNMGSMNYAKYSAKRKDFVFSFVFANPFDEIIFYLKQMNESGRAPRVRVLRHQPRGVARAAHRHGAH